MPRGAAQIYSVLCSLNPNPFASDFVVSASNADLADFAKVTSRTVQAATAWLADPAHRWIEVREHVGRANTYRILRPADVTERANPLDNPFHARDMVAAFMPVAPDLSALSQVPTHVRRKLRVVEEQPEESTAPAVKHTPDQVKHARALLSATFGRDNADDAEIAAFIDYTATHAVSDDEWRALGRAWLDGASQVCEVGLCQNAESLAWLRSALANIRG